MKITVIITTVAALTLTCAAAAQAHTMTRAKAAKEAWLALHDAAEAREGSGEILTEVDLNRRDCSRKSRHRFLCSGSVRYEPDDPDSFRVSYWCSADVVVRYRSRRSFVILTRVLNWQC